MYILPVGLPVCPEGRLALHELFVLMTTGSGTQFIDVSVADKQMKMQNDLAKAGSS